MRKWKALHVAVVAALACLLALGIGASTTGAKSNDEIPEYLGSKACLGCHVDHFTHWDDTAHANDLVQLIRKTDFPGDIAAAPVRHRASRAPHLQRRHAVRLQRHAQVARVVHARRLRAEAEHRQHVVLAQQRLNVGAINVIHPQLRAGGVLQLH